jgi:hypothetical protein
MTDAPKPCATRGPAPNAVLMNLAYRVKRIGLKAGPLSQWLFSALAGGIGQWSVLKRGMDTR